jgi:hypothetical protein
MSGQKFKTCCLPKLSPVVTEKDAENFLEQMGKPDLVFVTRENQDRIGELIAKRSTEVAAIQANCLHEWVNWVVPPGGGETKKTLPVCKHCGANYDESKTN